MYRVLGSLPGLCAEEEEEEKQEIIKTKVWPDIGLSRDISDI